MARAKLGREKLGVTLRAGIRDKLVQLADENQTTVSNIVEVLLEDSLRSDEPVAQRRRRLMSIEQPKA